MSVSQSLLQIAAGLRSQQPSIREDAADQIDFLLENALSNRSCIDEDVYSQVVTSLLQTALIEPDFGVKESMFSTLVNAACFPQASKIDWKLVVDALGELDGSLLEYVLPIIGFTHQREYETLLEEYLDHPDGDVRQSAKESLAELLGSTTEPGNYTG